MSVNDSLEIIYSHLGGLNKKLMTDDFYQYFLRCIKTGKNNVGLTKKVIERTLKGDWLEKIEDCVLSLDNIVRNPTRYIKNIEDIVPIETARGITTESIRHLAQHTSMIASVEDDGSVTPERILNVLKEESFDTYENRLFYTLLTHLDYFINKRLNLIKDSGKNIQEFVLNGECFIGKEKISYRLNFACEGNTTHAKVSREELINADVSKMDVNQRIERIRRILYEFNDSALVKQLKDCELVRPPIHLNNVLQKRPDYVKMVELWTFITAYTDDGIESNAVESTTMPDKAFMEEIYALLPLEYALMKQQMGGETAEVRVVDATVKSFSDPQVIREQIENFVDSLDMEVEDLKKVFNESIAKRTRKRTIERNRINNIIKRVLEIEKVWMAKEKERLKRKEKRLAEEAKREKVRLKELEKQQRALQKAAEAESKRLAKEEAIRLAEEAKRQAEEANHFAEQTRRLAEAEVKRQSELIVQGLITATQVQEPTIDEGVTADVTVEKPIDGDVLQSADEVIEQQPEVVDETIEQPVEEQTPTAQNVQPADGTVEPVVEVADETVVDEPTETAVYEQSSKPKQNIFARIGNWFKNLGKKNVSTSIEQTVDVIKEPVLTEVATAEVAVTEVEEIIPSETGTSELTTDETPVDETFVAPEAIIPTATIEERTPLPYIPPTANLTDVEPGDTLAIAASPSRLLTEEQVEDAPAEESITSQSIERGTESESQPPVEEGTTTEDETEETITEESTTEEGRSKGSIFIRIGRWIKNLGKKKRDTPATEATVELLVEEETVGEEHEGTTEEIEQLEDGGNQIEAQEVEVQIESEAEAEIDGETSGADQEDQTPRTAPPKGKTGWKDIRRKKRRQQKKKKPTQQ